MAETAPSADALARFDNLYAHGMARVAAFAPRVTVADPAANAEAVIALARKAHDDDAVLALFPELSLTGYAIDDLHHQTALLDAAEDAAARVIAASAALRPVILVGAPVRVASQLFNCALAVQGGRLLGVVPKSFLPNYREFYEKRWFSDAAGAPVDRVRFAGTEAPFGADLLFEAADLARFVLGVEICEDLWAPVPPSTDMALAGATVIANLSASNAVIGKARERAALVDAQSRKTLSAYVFAAAGPGESTNDLAWDGQLVAYELGRALAVSGRFLDAPAELSADIDLERIEADRLRLSTFRDAAARRADRVRAFRRVGFRLDPPTGRAAPLRREIDRFPFVPNDPARLDEDCFEAYQIQVQGLAQRLRATGIDRAVIGVSGGLDSTQALLVAARAFDRLGLPRDRVTAVWMPGFASGEATRANAEALIAALGVERREIDIRPAAKTMLADLGHPYAEGQPVYDVTFENVQAGLRTDYLFRLANHLNGLVVGTGDLSELALGWCTYGVGDQMAHYNVNAGVAKTLIQHLIAWCAEREPFGEGARETLLKILDSEISPELVPASPEGGPQSTEAVIGPYALQDFTLHHAARFGLGPEKIAFLAWTAWGDAARGRWPDRIAPADRRSYDLAEIVAWLDVFARRFYQQSQFKRTAMPNGPKVTSAGALSPRGDWRAPSDASARAWLDRIAALKARLGLD